MPLPVIARVRAVPHFLAGLHAAQAFMAHQDAASAPARFAHLQAEIRRARELLTFAPTSGRPARLLQASSGWGRYQAEQARQLAAQVGLPELRELVLDHHALLYAHGDAEVVLLALRPARQQGYANIGP